MGDSEAVSIPVPFLAMPQRRNTFVAVYVNITTASYSHQMAQFKDDIHWPSVRKLCL